MDHPRPWLRYVDAGDLVNSKTKLDGMRVESKLAEKLGEVDGFIVDVSSARPYYVVVDGGGWFKSKFFLVPIGHVGLASTKQSLVADITKERIERYPGFDRGEFEELSDDELRRMDDQMIAACCPAETATAAGSSWRLDSRSHYKAPGWWDADFYRPDRADTAARSMAGVYPPRNETQAAHDRETVVAQAGDVSPHLDGRAQPGDVLGLETGGERTYVGDTSEDENKRRHDAEKAGKQQRK